MLDYEEGSLKDRKEPLKGFEQGKACSKLSLGMSLWIKGVEWNSAGKRLAGKPIGKLFPRTN